MKTKRPRINFYEIGIPEGAILKCKKTNDQVRVVGPKTVAFRGEEMSLTKATLLILNDNSTPSIAHQWLYEGECLRHVYDRTHPKKAMKNPLPCYPRFSQTYGPLVVIDTALR